MDAWWNTLILPLQIFYGIGIIAGLVLAVEVLASLFGFHHHHLLHGFDHSGDIGPISVRTVTGFFFGFGWTGAIAIRSGCGLFLSIVAASFAGAVFLFAIFLLMRALYSLQSSGTLDYRNAIGEIATVYVTVPPGMAGGGQVEVLIQGRLQTISCLTKHTEALAPQTKVRVVGLIGQGTLEVQPL